MCIVCKFYRFTVIPFIIVDHTIIQVGHTRRYTGSVSRCGEPVTNSRVYLDETTKPIIINCVGFFCCEAAILLTRQLSAHHSVRLFANVCCVFCCILANVTVKKIERRKGKMLSNLRVLFHSNLVDFSTNPRVRLYRVEKNMPKPSEHAERLCRGVHQIP